MSRVHDYAHEFEEVLRSIDNCDFVDHFFANYHNYQIELNISSSSSPSSSSSSSSSLWLRGISLHCNLSIVDALCRDKQLTYSILRASSIDVVEHMFVNGVLRRFDKALSATSHNSNSNIHVSDWDAVHEFYLKHACDIVLKPHTGLSGSMVMRASSLSALTHCYRTLHAKTPAFVATPFVRAQREIRVIVSPTRIDKKIRKAGAEYKIHDFNVAIVAVIRKLPLFVDGDGVHTLSALIHNAVRERAPWCDAGRIIDTLKENTHIEITYTDTNSRNSAHNANSANRDTQSTTVTVNSVLPVGARWTSWYFNHSHGAQFMHVERDDEREACKLALSAAKCMGIVFGCVDVLMPQCVMLECNTMVTTDILDLEDKQKIKEIIHDALLYSHTAQQHYFECAKNVVATTTETAITTAEPIATPLSSSSSSQSSSSSSSSSAIVSSLSLSLATASRSTVFSEKAATRKSLVSFVCSELGGTVKSSNHHYLLTIQIPNPSFSSSAPSSSSSSSSLSTSSSSSFVKLFNIDGNFSHILSLTFQLLSSKSLTSIALKRAGVECVPHYLIVMPVNTDKVSKLMKRAEQPSFPSSLSLMSSLLSSHGALVLKPDTGSGGRGCTVVRTLREAERALLILGADNVMCVSPFINSGNDEDDNDGVHEYRCIVIGGVCVMVVQKQRPFVVGDGVSTVIELAVSYARTHGLTDFLHSWITDSSSSSSSSSSPLRIPECGKRVLLTWKHNMDEGAVPKQMSVNSAPVQVTRLAVRAASALLLAYGAVDILMTTGAGASASAAVTVLEVNGTPGWSHTMCTMPETTKQVLTTVVKTAASYQHPTIRMNDNDNNDNDTKSHTI